MARLLLAGPVVRLLGLLGLLEMLEMLGNALGGSGGARAQSWDAPCLFQRRESHAALPDAFQ